jgi:hypothetical protein
MTRGGTGEVVGLVAAGLAAFFAVLGLVPGILTVSQAQPGLNSPQTLVLLASDATYLSPVTLAEVSGAHLDQTEQLTPDGAASSSSVSTWTVDTSLYDTTHRQQLEPASRTFAIDRATQRLVSCCGANINGNLLIRQTGLSGYVFPAGAGRQSYDVFDTVLRRPEPAAYSGAGTIDGIQAYQYTENVTDGPAGFSSLSATDPELYSVRESWWVDPRTGAVLAISVAEDLHLAGPAAVRLLDADLATTPATVARLAAQDRAVRHQTTVARDLRLACLVLAVAGAVVAGYALSRRRPPPAPRHPRTGKRPGKDRGQAITGAVKESGIENAV